MMRLARGMLWALALLVLGAVALWFLGPREAVPARATFDPARFGGDLDAYFAAQEARFDDITPGVEKRVVWAGAHGATTPLSILYVHGFSATSEEIRPVPDRVAERLGANLVYTRLTGHGRDGPAMAEAEAADWMEDIAEGLAAARAAGGRVVVMATSTGASLATLALADPAMSRDVAAAVLISPNFGVNNALAPILTWPAARVWLPWVAGETRGFEPVNARQARYWTTRYPVEAVVPMAATVKAARRLDHARIGVPALFWFSEADAVVRAEATRAVADGWGAETRLREVTPGPGDDPAAHVLAGDILSPGLTEAAVDEMTAWLRARTDG
ncbi:alpha/beta hydrolase [Rhodosalinus halophilus]|uniref:Alpha/beta hydrolase n=1 Tax=Rhodosalinus halophilus TaxID=2259333 RepID=A0A365U4D2_9RHOB|nr:alpha/beta fold hydrolase [Rhodosalinus halophilus]RBI82964.1 alpha/beta hydrolase [Rhodosalinus halophilus]